MFRILGIIVSRYWFGILALWIAAVVLAVAFAPSWDDVSKSGEVAFLPENTASRRGDKLYKEAFPLQYSGSNIVLVLSRDNEQLRDEDFELVRNELIARLGDVALADENSPITTVRTFVEEGVGKLLVSPDRQATLVLAELSTAFQEEKNDPLVGKIEQMVNKLREEGKIPQGLSVGVTGSAAAGRDLNAAEGASVNAIENWTIAIVVILLLLLYRAPLVAVIPLVTVGVSVALAIGLLGLSASSGFFAPSRDLRVFVTVLAYGAGVDYCLFLIARYREELEHHASPRDAIATSVDKVGHAIVASAATVIAGIAMLFFARFGKIHEAGIVIPFALTITLIGTLTFAPALLRLAGRFAFWPRRIEHKPKPEDNDALHRVLEADMPNLWHRVGPTLLRHPGAIWLGTVLVMVPFVIVALLKYDETNFNPLGDLSSRSPSVQANRVLAKHFPLGALSPVTLLIRNDKIDFASDKGIALIERLNDKLQARLDDVGLADVRSIAHPLGVSTFAKEVFERYRMEKSEMQDVLRKRAVGYYVSGAEDVEGKVTKLDLTLTSDPLSQGGIDNLVSVEKVLPSLLPKELKGSQIEFVGATASLRDLSEIKRSDQYLIQILVSIVVLLLLIILLRRVVVSIYLIVSVLFSYLATLGLTYLVFRYLPGEEFSGLDWKVPIFLFTILVAVGEDYNIFLLTRIKEERHHHGPLAAIPVALARTGQVISSCGFVMAGTFAALLSGSLQAMLQLGFALAMGVLIDTLIVRPILVPAFLVLLQRFIPGRLGRYMALGAREEPAIA